MKTFTAIERQQTSIPISEVLSADGSLEIFPEVRSKGYFELDFRGGELVLVSGKYVGHIPLNARILIDIRPKVGVVRLTQLLEKAHEPLRCLEFYKRAYKMDELSGEGIFEILVRAFATSTRKIATEGTLRDYVHVRADIPTIRGRVDALQTMRRHHARGIFNRAHCTYFDLRVDNPLNRLIKYALWYSASHLLAHRSQDRPLRAELADLYRYFDAVPLDTSMRFVEQSRTYLATRRVPVLRNYYVETCDIALAIISESGLDLLGQGRDIHAASFLLDMETIFEQYIRNVLRNAPLTAARGKKVLDGNKEGRGWLFIDSKSYEAKPDLLVKSGSAIQLVGDVKYKPKISEQDRYQVITHSLSFGASKALIVLPTISGENSKLERIGRAGKEHGVELFVYRFNLEAVDLIPEETKFVASVLDIVPPSPPQA